jgi:hypothetical protein
VKCYSGGTLAVNVVIRTLELRNLASSSHQPINLPLPTAVVLNYAALDFNFTSWMSAENLRVLRSEQSSGNIPGLKEVAELKDHLKHVVSKNFVRFCQVGYLPIVTEPSQYGQR